MKKALVIAVASLLLFALICAVAFLRPPSLQSSARREWKQKSLVEIAARVAEPAWPTNELAQLNAQSTSETSEGAGWLSEDLIVMTNGQWMAYRYVCQKEEKQIKDLFLGLGSDGRWYYSTFHFCVGMQNLTLEGVGGQPGSLTEFSKKYYLREFDGHSDECLRDSRPKH